MISFAFIGATAALGLGLLGGKPSSSSVDARVDALLEDTHILRSYNTDAYDDVRHRMLSFFDIIANPTTRRRDTRRLFLLKQRVEGGFQYLQELRGKKEDKRTQAAIDDALKSLDDAYHNYSHRTY